MEKVVAAQVLDQASIARNARAVGRWELELDRSSIGFTVKKLWGLITVKGTFADAVGEVTVGDDGSVSGLLDIAAASVVTGQRKRDEHVRSKDFFDVEHFPRMRVQIDRVVLAGVDRGHAHGRLTILGETRPIEFDVTIALGSTGEKATVTGSLAIDRFDYGMSWNKLGVVARTIAVEVELAYHRAG